MRDREKPIKHFAETPVGEFGAEGNNSRIVFQVSKEVLYRLRRSIGVGCTQQQHCVKGPVQLNGFRIPLYDLHVIPVIYLDPSPRVDRYFRTNFHSNYFSGRPDCFDQVRETSSGPQPTSSTRFPALS